MECIRCGICCTRYQAYLTLGEAKRIAREMGESWQLWRAKYTDPRWPGTESFLLLHQNGACIFLKREDNGKTTGCLIHRVKPSSCKSWLSGWDKRECREGLLAYWELTVNAHGELQGTAEKIRDFNVFIASLS